MNRLVQDPPDVIISDHAMPQFSAAEALQCLQESGLTIPFIVVSHAIGEEEAVQLMRNGATDYLLKDRMGRLGEAVRHALEERQLRSQYAEAQEELRILNQGFGEADRGENCRTRGRNSALARELSERKQIEQRLRQLADTLEERVKERTQQLSTSYARLRALATDLTIAEQTERRRLATELHDYLAQMLVVTRMKVGQLLKQDHESGSAEDSGGCRSVAPPIARLHPVAGVGADTPGPVRARTGRRHPMARGSDAPASGTERRD